MGRKVLRYVSYKRFTDSDFELSSKFIFPSLNDTIDRSRKGTSTIHSACNSVQRAHKKLYEVLRSNEWKYFLTLTFGDSERVSDQYCRDCFSAWRKEVKAKFPDMYYVAVPEYHLCGSIHYHVVVGGVTGADLGFVDSGRVLHCGKAWRRQDFIDRGFVANDKTGEGATIYNIGAWKNGFSTATEIRCSEAVTKYVSKYLTKNDLDPRFFNKKRFYASHNCHRPEVVTDVSQVDPFSFSDELTKFAEVCFANPKYLYTQYDCAEDLIRARLLGLEPMHKHKLPFKLRS